MNLFKLLAVSGLILIYLPLQAQNTEKLPVAKDSIQEKEGTKTQEEKETEKKSVKLNTLVITATKTKEKQKDVPVHVDVITSKEIEDTGIDTLGDIIGQKITGHYHRYSGLSQPAGLMGNLATDAMGDHTGGRVIVLVDGHNIGTGNIGKIPADIIERVEVIKGPASSLYGSSAIGGVINIITKKGKGDIQNTIKTNIGSFNYGSASLSSGGSINDYASYFITAGITQAGDVKTKNYGTAYNSNTLQKNIWGNISLYPTDFQTARLGFSYEKLISHYPQWQSYTDYTYYDNTVDQYSDLSRGHSDLEYNLGMLEGKLNWKAAAYFLWDRRSWYWGTANVKDDSSANNDYTVGTDQTLSISLIPLNKLLLGYTFEILKRNSESKAGGVKIANTTPDFNYYTNSVYVQDTLSLFSNKLLLIYGARYDRFHLDTEDSGSSLKDVTFDNITQRGGVVYKIVEPFRIRGNIGQGFRAPNADELTMTYLFPGWSNYLGNPDLKPEKSVTYDGGFDVYADDFNFGATYSYITTKDFIIYEYSYTDANGDWYIYKNVDKAKMQIVDCYAGWNAGDSFDLPFKVNISSNITYNIKYEDSKTGEKLRFIPDWEIKSNFQTIYKNFTLTLSHVYVGSKLSEDYSEKKSVNFFDLSSNIAIAPNLSVNGGIFNLTNQDYSWIHGYPMPERNYKIGLTGKF